MRTGNQFFSAIQFLLVLLLFLGGGSLLGLHYVYGARQALADWILEGHNTFLILGALVLGVATLLLFSFYAMHRHPFIRFRMGERGASFDQALVKQRLEKLWEEEFTPQPVDVHFSRGKIEVITRGELEDLEQIEERLKSLFAEEFGYSKEFHISLR